MRGQFLLDSLALALDSLTHSHSHQHNHQMAHMEVPLRLSSSDEMSWIEWFCSKKGHEFFCEVEESYITVSLVLSDVCCV